MPKLFLQNFIWNVCESIKTSGKTSVAVISGNQRTKLRASFPSYFLLMAVLTTWICWGKHFGIISTKTVTQITLPWDGCQQYQEGHEEKTVLDATILFFMLFPCFLQEPQLNFSFIPAHQRIAKQAMAGHAHGLLHQDKKKFNN